MRSYSCMPRQHLEYGPYAISTVQDAHIEAIRLWRNAQMDVLRQDTPIDGQRQIYYFNSNIWPSMLARQPSNLMLVFSHEGNTIGYGGLMHIAWPHIRAEVSFLLAPERTKKLETYCADFSAFLSLLKTLAFQDLKLHRLFTETYDIRQMHINTLEANGFVREGVLRDHVRIGGRFVDAIFHGCFNELER